MSYCQSDPSAISWWSVDRVFLNLTMPDHYQLTAFRPQGLAGRCVRGDWEKRRAVARGERAEPCRISVALSWRPLPLNDENSRAKLQNVRGDSLAVPSG